MIVKVIELNGERMPNDFWKYVILHAPWKTEYMDIEILTFDDSILFLN
jgi:hypothetical protein